MTRAGRLAIEAGAAAVVTRLLGLLPRRAALVLGRGLGRLWGDLDRRHVRVAVDNLRHAFPHWDEARRLRTARGVYAHFGQILLDILWLSERPCETVLSVVDVEGREHVEGAVAAGHGLVVVTAHFGNWEAHGVAHGLLFGPLGVVARPLDNPRLDERLCAFRGRSGNPVIYKQRALVQVLKMLRAGGGVAILIDQNVQEGDGIFVDFFGRPAATTTVAAALAVKTGCALVPVQVRLGDDGRYRAIYEPAVRWTTSGDRQRDIAHLTQALTYRIEAWVREAPEQWLWIHRRWKTQPGKEAISSQQSAFRTQAIAHQGSPASHQPSAREAGNLPARGEPEETP
ncbi:MAG TPA: lysophospholipid acyltransferase family protein [Vicinamibacteria bacterium]|nr:lysophospholipid acyltransferase family protein [Vicinamibacteria bacterium]